METHIRGLRNSRHRIAESAPGGDRSADFNIERRKPIASIRDEGLGLNEKGDYLTICGYIQFIKKDGPNPPWYPACQACNKKAIEGMGGQWNCEVCSKQFDQPIWRYLINFQMQDYSGYSWFNLFDESGQKLFGVSADFLEDLRSHCSDSEMKQIYDLPLFRMFTAIILTSLPSLFYSEGQGEARDGPGRGAH